MLRKQNTSKIADTANKGLLVNEKPKLVLSEEKVSNLRKELFFF